MMNDAGGALAGAVIEPELAAIAAICSGTVKYMEEAGRRYVHMVGLRFLVRGADQQMDALLCLDYPNGTYPTKLYLPANLGLGLNWNETAFILAKNWFTWSWSGVSPNQPPLAILGGHLEAFR
ncbi:hypothetical protein [Bradyrhizobium arachidis]|uniref:hypothetical protein n=1 Tax=Bradyrhizobium arachidis TaxID=858423 RepID=UPI00216204F1|nr:hypothetical protein [Bradyrhizobium arachidis]UVO30332.1 hypothetical protein KUF59_06210 [Bradyrhizobium arachidis]